MVPGAYQTLANLEPNKYSVAALPPYDFSRTLPAWPADEPVCKAHEEAQANPHAGSSRLIVARCAGAVATRLVDRQTGPTHVRSIAGHPCPAKTILKPLATPACAPRQLMPNRDGPLCLDRAPLTVRPGRHKLRQDTTAGILSARCYEHTPGQPPTECRQECASPTENLPYGGVPATTIVPLITIEPDARGNVEADCVVSANRRLFAGRARCAPKTRCRGERSAAKTGLAVFLDTLQGPQVTCPQ